MSEDGGLFHAHGSYLPDGMSPNEVSGMVVIVFYFSDEKVGGNARRYVFS
jgi:hypothetical protein